MTNIVYQARVGDGFRNKGYKRTNTYFNTPQEAVSEALALKEKMDTKYKNEIEWDYTNKITGRIEKMKILKGYHRGDKNSKTFFLQILSVQRQDEFSITTPIKPKKVSSKDERIMTKVLKLFNSVPSKK